MTTNFSCFEALAKNLAMVDRLCRQSLLLKREKGRDHGERGAGGIARSKAGPAFLPPGSSIKADRRVHMRWLHLHELAGLLLPLHLFELLAKQHTKRLKLDNRYPSGRAPVLNGVDGS